jgi:hypothetical protein
MIMQKLRTRLICCAFAWSISAAAQAAPPIRLLCSGEIVSVTDLKKKEVDKLFLNVTIDLDKRTIRIPEFWGCFADIGNLDAPHKRQACAGEPLPITITPEEFTFHDKSEDWSFTGKTSLTINRYSGTLTISSIATAKPAARATWWIINTDGKLMCTTPTKKF